MGCIGERDCVLRDGGIACWYIMSSVWTNWRRSSWACVGCLLALVVEEIVREDVNSVIWKCTNVSSGFIVRR